ncbi:TlpA family protein disulfide reductase [Nocardia sp. BSTN01]|uniref:TlpA family protein disulfide reductase n=1 Tax=Nocardia sp. BSTN01 TaxID=2783665 RepID=UPI0018908FF2|nr:TlpA disulfide reductase family protein [Nocardia sp. BSTN01]MBF4999039.1 TlpA family protein disulfide reductase [Nocardia sp. BSTN01]
MKSVPTAWRWAFVILIAVVALAVAVWPRGDDHGPSVTTTAVQGGPASASDGQRAAAALADCPRPGDPTGRPPTPVAGPLAGITVECLADGRPVDLGEALAGRPALVNLWAYWCEPCARELPALQQFSARAGSALTVLTVHSDPDEGKAMARLRDLDVHLPGAQDGAGKVRTAVRAPAVLPVSVLVRADGSIAKVVVRPFDTADDVAATVAQELGVRV